MKSKVEFNKMENGAKIEAQHAFDLLMSKEDPQFILVYELSEERAHVFASGKGDSVMAMYMSVAERLYEVMGYDSLSEFFIKLSAVAMQSELVAEREN